MKAKCLLSLESLLKLLVAIYIASLFFSDTLMPSIYVRYGALITIVLVSFMYSLHNKIKLCINSSMIWWILFFMFALLNCCAHGQMNSLTLRWFLPFGCILTIIILLAGSNNVKILTCIPSYIVAFASVHVGITILCWIFPQIYDNIIYPLFFSDIPLIVGRGYQSAFTAHYSTNAIYISLGLLCLPAIAKSNRRQLIIVLYILFGFALILTEKRAHTAFTIIAIIITWWVVSTRKIETLIKMPILVVGLALCVMALAQWLPEMNALLSRFAEVLSDDTFGGRNEFYELCIQMWRESPLFGDGWGSYTLRFNQTSLGAEYLATGFTTMMAHEVYLQVLAENGIVGFLLFIFALFASFRTIAIRANSYAVDASGKSQHGTNMLEMTNLKLTLFCGISLQVFFLLYCFTGNPLYDEIVYAPFLLLLLVNLAVATGPLRSVAISSNRSIDGQTA